MEIVTDRKSVNKLIFLFTITYMVSYLTRINYGAVISEMESATQIPRDLLSMAVTGSFITYGVGQIISGILGDKFAPKSLMTFGLVLTVLMNTILPFCTNPYLMLAVWCVNGFAQSFMWPPLVRLMSSLLSSEDYKSAGVKVSWGSSIGTIVIYLCSPLLISVFNWKAVFWSAAIIGTVMIFIWCKFTPNVIPEKREKLTNCAKNSKHVLFTPVMIAIMIAIIAMGMLRDGVTTWMPSYISETYSLSSAVSILSGGILPVFSILSCQLGSKVYGKLKRVLLCAVLFFGLGALAAAAMVLFAGRQAVVSVVCAAVLTGSMHGVNLMLISMIPPFFKKYGNVSMASGVLNSCTYVGSAVSTYGIAVLSDGWGWNLTLILWILMALLGLAACAAAMRPWKENMETDMVIVREESL